MILPDFPLLYWNINGFTGIANAIGNFIMMEADHLTRDERSTPQVLVGLDILGGLPMDLEVVWEDGYFV